MAPPEIPHALSPLLPSALQGETVIAFDCAALLGASGPFPIEGIRHFCYIHLDAEFLATERPSFLIIPLFSASYDAASAVETLEKLGYRGRIAVMAPSLPKPRLVEKELRGMGPGDRLILISP